MPNIKHQKVDLGDGFEISTNEYGLLEVRVQTVGSVTTVSCFKDSVLQQAPTITNATPSSLEAVITNFLNQILVGAVSAPQHVHIACHVENVNPFVFNIMSSNSPILAAAQWWL
jgi:hypothetical protein